MDITFRQVTHEYMKNTPFQSLALKDINLTIESGSFTAVVGQTGSGKSTLAQHINGLLKPTNGHVRVGNVTIEPKSKGNIIKPLRKKVGFVFQYPEHQLFEETVEADILFGPKNIGLNERTVKKKLPDILHKVGLEEDILKKSPFELSGGQMRRVAIASVLAMNPEILILDEPTAGLDPNGRNEMMEMFESYHKEYNVTTLLITHNMSDVARYADQVIVMNKGAVELTGKPEDVFMDVDRIIHLGLDLPESLRFVQKLQERLGINNPYYASHPKEVVSYVKTLFTERKGL